MRKRGRARDCPAPDCRRRSLKRSDPFRRNSARSKRTGAYFALVPLRSTSVTERTEIRVERFDSKRMARNGWQGRSRRNRIDGARFGRSLTLLEIEMGGGASNNKTSKEARKCPDTRRRRPLVENKTNAFLFSFFFLSIKKYWITAKFIRLKISCT